MGDDKLEADARQNGTNNDHNGDVDSLTNRRGVAEKIRKWADMIASDNSRVNKIRLQSLNQAGRKWEIGEERENDWKRKSGNENSKANWYALSVGAQIETSFLGSWINNSPVVCLDEALAIDGPQRTCL